MSIHSLSSCRRNLLPQLVLDPDVISNLSERDVSKLSFAQIKKLARENAAFAAKVEQLKPMREREVVCLHAKSFFEIPGLVSEDFLRSMQFELAKPLEERRYFLDELCIQHVLERAEDSKETYLLALKVVSSSKISGLLRKTLLSNPSMMHVVDLGPFLVNLCRFQESYEENLNVFCELYNLYKIDCESLAKVLCKVAEFKNADLFEKLCKPEIFERLPLALKCDVAVSTLNIAQHPIFSRIWSQLNVSQMSSLQIITALTIAASHNDVSNFKSLLTKSIDPSDASKNIRTDKCGLIQSARLTDPSMFSDLVVRAERLEVSANDLGQMLEYGAASCNEKVISFVFHHKQASGIDEYYLGQSLITAAKTDNSSLIERLLGMDRTGDMESSCIETAFEEGVLKRHNTSLLKLFESHKLLDQVKPTALFEALKYFAKEDDFLSCRLLMTSVGAETIHSIASFEDLASLLETYVAHDRCDLIAEILETKLLERLPFPMMQRLFDFAFANRSRAMLRLILNSPKSSELNPVSIFEAIKRLKELNQLSFFEIAAIEYFQALSRGFPQCSPQQKVELVRIISNLAISVDCAAVLQHAINMEEFQRFDQKQIDAAICYADTHKRSNCLDVMLTPRYFNRVSEAVSKQFSYEPV